MTGTLLFFGGLVATALWWLSRQGLATKPWLGAGTVADMPTIGTTPALAAKVGLGIFMTVAATLLVLLLSAYSMRMEMVDWSPPPRPPILWANTIVLMLASVALNHVVRVARKGRRDAVAFSLLLGGGAGLLFVLGQALAWWELSRSGYLPANNPANAFFYLITALHGLHLLGGLVALSRVRSKLRQASLAKLQLSLDLCASYWHFLLLTWIVLFVTLAFAPPFDWLVALCTVPFRQD